MESQSDNRVKLANPATLFGFKPPVPEKEMTHAEFRSWIKIVLFWDKAADCVIAAMLGALAVLVVVLLK